MISPVPLVVDCPHHESRLVPILLLMDEFNAITPTRTKPFVEVSVGFLMCPLLPMCKDLSFAFTSPYHFPRRHFEICNNSLAFSVKYSPSPWKHNVPISSLQCSASSITFRIVCVRSPFSTFFSIMMCIPLHIRRHTATQTPSSHHIATSHSWCDARSLQCLPVIRPTLCIHFVKIMFQRELFPFRRWISLLYATTHQ